MNGLHVVALRPYSARIRSRVFGTLERLGARVTAHVEEGVPDDHTLAAMRATPADVLLIPFHAHRDRNGELVHGLTLIERIRTELPAHAATPILCPISTVGLAAAELLQTRVDAAILHHVLFLPESELSSVTLPDTIATFVRGARA
ncbi:MAG: hypothetical protein CMN30_03705 [Sandaracinus sp.]|nr:hypothetical protein [Sandaracinus sp.]|tara:strand:- start:1360 stop:1797 length:438 start_codon:yes stop_codon:yes gene_type:complete